MSLSNKDFFLISSFMKKLGDLIHFKAVFHVYLRDEGFELYFQWNINNFPIIKYLKNSPLLPVFFTVPLDKALLTLICLLKMGHFNDRTANSFKLKIVL